MSPAKKNAKDPDKPKVLCKIYIHTVTVREQRCTVLQTISQITQLLLGSTLLWEYKSTAAFDMSQCSHMYCCILLNVLNVFLDLRNLGNTELHWTRLDSVFCWVGLPIFFRFSPESLQSRQQPGLGGGQFIFPFFMYVGQLFSPSLDLHLQSTTLNSKL